MLKRWMLWSLLFVLAVMLCIGFYNPLTLTHYEISDPDLPQGLDGYRIVQISDLHGKLFGQNQESLIQMIQQAQPDLILLTGDIIDKQSSNLNSVKLLLEGISQIAPIYSVAGNHEYLNFPLYYGLTRLFSQYNVTELRDEGRILVHNGAHLCLFGIGAYHTATSADDDPLTLPVPPEGYYGILAYHFSTGCDFVASIQSGYSILFAGHSHGGIIRLPFLGPVIGNRWTLFPKYAGGLFVQDDLTIVVSRGMSQTIIPRFNNPMELVCVTLHKSA